VRANFVAHITVLNVDFTFMDPRDLPRQRYLSSVVGRHNVIQWTMATQLTRLGPILMDAMRVVHAAYKAGTRRTDATT